jgi:signal transduction histidine kinase
VTLKISLHTRFTIWVTILIFVLVCATLYVIQTREVATVFEESKNKGLLMARSLADLNLRSLIFNDIEPIQSTIQEQINAKLLYIVFFDRFATALVYNREIADRKEIFCCSHLQGDIRPESVFARAINVYVGRKIQRVLELEIPIFARGSADKWGSVKIGLSLEDMRAEIRKTRLVLILIGLAVLLLGMSGATLLARGISRPIRKLAEGTVRIAKGDFSNSIPIDSQDELGHLARSFNAMTTQLLATREAMEKAQKKLVQAEKLASIGRLAATIAHEIRNPLTSVKLNIQKVAKDGRLEALEQEHLSISQEGIVQIEKFIKELLNFTRVSELQLARFPVSQILDESLKLMSDSFKQRNIAVEKKLDPGLPEILVDGDKLRQVFLNLLRNAFEAMENGGKINLAVSTTGDGPGRKIKIRISDNGCGIPEKDWENIFEPFFSMKSSGFGLGLANARKIIEQHKGTVRVVKKRSPGTAFEILIPGEGEP